MPKYAINYTTNELYCIEIEASSLKEAMDKVNAGEFEESQAKHEATEFLGASIGEQIST